jgi:hypothetical protein
MHTAQRTRKEKMKKLKKEEEARGSGWKSLVSLKEEEEGEREKRTRHIDPERREESDIHFFFQPSSERLLFVRTDRFVSVADGRRDAYVTITAEGYVQYGTVKDKGKRGLRRGWQTTERGAKGKGMEGVL